MTTALHLPPLNFKTSSFLCQDQLVKVDSNIYHLDRLRSSLKSKYFKKLFTSGDFKQKNDKILEIQPKNSDLFPTVIDLLHGKKLFDVLNKDNYIPLLEAMDFLKMEIDLHQVSRFIDESLKTDSPQDTKMFELLSFIRQNSKFEYLFPSVLKFMSDHLTAVRNHEVFSSLPFSHLIRIIKNVKNPDDEKRYEIVQMCAEWLCHDMENRLPHMVVLINSIKPEFHSKKKTGRSESKLSKSLPKTDIDEQAKRKTMVCCVFSLLAYGGKLNPSILKKQETHYDRSDMYESDCYPLPDESSDDYEVYEQKNYPERFVHKNDECAKLKKFLKKNNFCDITVQIGENTTCMLHRAVLETKCGYFADIFFGLSIPKQWLKVMEYQLTLV